MMFVSCEQLNIEVADADIPVIESYIAPGYDHSLKITRQSIYNSEDTSSTYINNLEVYLTINSEIIQLNNEADGRYTLYDYKIDETDELSLELNYNNRTLSAETAIPTKPKNFQASTYSFKAFSYDNYIPGSGVPDLPDPIVLNWTNADNEYHMVVIKNMESDPKLINTNTNRPSMGFLQAPTQSDNLNLSPMAFSYYGKHHVILFKLKPEYAALYEQVGSSSLDLTTPPSNITNGLGIFTGINADTLTINVY
jgi:hypothetical protein